MRFGFVTCVQLGLSCMEEIYAQGGTLALALTLPDANARRKAGRVYLDGFCRDRGVPLLKVGSINDPEAVAAIREGEIDWLFIIGWSQIAHGEVLGAVRRGALGIHPTLLPEGRGRAAIPWAILLGLERTGVTLFQLDEGVDTGPILAQVALPMAPDENAGGLYARVAGAHRTLIRQVWQDLVGDRLRPVPQESGSGSVWAGRTPEDGRILPSMAPWEVDRLVRATTRPYPGAFLDEAAGRLRIWEGRVPAAGEGVPAGTREVSLERGRYLATRWDLERAVSPPSSGPCGSA
jgi:methionyl-tRNA formyltransferase